MSIILPTSPGPVDVSPSYLDAGGILQPIFGGVDQKLNRLGDRFACDYTLPPMPFGDQGTVLEGVRSDADAYANFGKGRTAAQLAAKGVPTSYAKPALARVTWLSNPLATKHRKQRDGYGHAVDLAPFPIDWNDYARFDRLGTLMQAAAKAEGVAIRWGADWDGDGKPRERGETDSPHFELAR